MLRVSSRILFTILFDGRWYMFGLYSWWFGVCLFIFSFRTERVIWLAHEHWRKENESVNHTTYWKLLYSISALLPVSSFVLAQKNAQIIHNTIQCPCLWQSRAQCPGEWSLGDNHTLCSFTTSLLLSFFFHSEFLLEPPWRLSRAGVQKDIGYVSSALRSDCGKLCMAFMLLWSFYYYWDLCCLEYFLEHLLLLTFFDRMMYLKA